MSLVALTMMGVVLFVAIATLMVMVALFIPVTISVVTVMGMSGLGVLVFRAAGGARGWVGGSWGAWGPGWGDAARRWAARLGTQWVGVRTRVWLRKFFRALGDHWKRGVNTEKGAVHYQHRLQTLAEG